MLKGIPGILSPDLLKILMEMGHGDEIVLADGNFPAAAYAQRLVRCDGHGVPELLDAILELFPLDTYVSNTYTFDGKVFGLSKADILWLSGEPSWPKSPQNTVKAFLDAVKLNLEQEAMGFLSHSCRNRMPYREIKGLLGEFEGWHELDFPHPAYSTPHIGLGLLYPIHQKYRKLEAFFFETVEEPNHQGLYKINRIGKISSPVV
jgi:hypothetical protein